jgi:3-oxoacyl-[acyl-carrier protein] reductase
MSQDKFDLQGKVAIIIGGTKGMGLASAERFASSGAKLMISSRSAADADAVAADLNARYGKGSVIAVGMAGDMARRVDLQAIVDATVSRFGKITTLVASPTVRPWFGSAIDMPDDEIDEQFLYIFKSRFWIGSMCIREMRKSGGGSIIFIGSGSAFEATGERSIYACLRAAEVKLVHNFAAEFGKDNIRVNIISPAMINSSGAQALFADPKVREEFSSRLPMQRHGEVEEIASAITFLASEASSFTTGAVIPVDGGRNLHAQPSRLSGHYTPDKDDRFRGKAEPAKAGA